MGPLDLFGTVYLDTAPIIYSVEKHDDYWPLIYPIWKASKDKNINIVTSELVLLETLVGPLKNNHFELASIYETFLTQTELQLVPISRKVLKDAAILRANLQLKTPDAIQAATALSIKCDLFITNDKDFLRLPTLSVILLDELLKSDEKI